MRGGCCPRGGRGGTRRSTPGPVAARSRWPRAASSRSRPGAGSTSDHAASTIHYGRLLLLAGERGVEGAGRRIEGEPAHEGQRLGCTHQAVHARVLPLDRDGSAVADRVERPETVLPRDVTVPGGDEVPAPSQVGPGQVGGESTAAPVAGAHLRVL